MEIKKADATFFADKENGSLHAACGSNVITSKAVFAPSSFIKGNMINGEMQAIYSEDTDDQSNQQDCASIPIYLFAAPPSAMQQFTVASFSDSGEKSDETLANPLTFYSNVSTSNPQLISFVSKANTGSSFTKDSTVFNSNEVLNSFVLGNNHLSVVSSATSNKANETLHILQDPMECFNLTDATDSILKKDSGLQTCDTTKNNEKIIIITENDNLNSADVCTDAITMQDSAIETKESDYNDLSNLPLCDPLVDNIQTPVFDNEVHVISSKKKQITKNQTAEELLRSQPVLHMDFRVEAEIADFSGATVGREITTQTVPLRKPNTSRKKPEKILNNRREPEQQNFYRPGPELKVILTTDDDSIFNNANIENDNSKPYKCPKCSLKFTHQSTLDTHIKCHSPNGPDDKRYFCFVCDYIDTQWIKMHNHLFTHGFKKPYNCDKCSFGCLNKGDLVAHMFVHSTTKNWDCPKCKRTFKHRRNMKSHSRTCLGLDDNGKPIKNICSDQFICKVCNKQLSNKRSLEKHMEIHLDVKPFVCNLCGHATRLKESLITHKRLHTGEKPFKCDICDYSTPDKSSLRRHKRKHTNDKPYACHLCDYKAIQKHCLDTHIHRHHTGEKFVCALCNYETYQRYGLNQHFKLHHRDELEANNDETCIVNVTPAVVLKDNDTAGPSNLILMPAANNETGQIKVSSGEMHQQPSTSNNVQLNQSDTVLSSTLSTAPSMDSQNSALELVQQIQEPGDVLYVQENGNILIRKEDGKILIIQQIEEAGQVDNLNQS